MRSEHSISVTSSLALEAGRLRSSSPDGAAQSGQVAARASHSVSQASGAEQLTLGISGPSGSGSLRSAALSRSLANKLQVVTATLGSTLFKLTWKEWATPSGWSFPLLRATGRRTSGTASTSWPTPQAAGSETSYQAEHKIGTNHALNLHRAAQLASWPSPQARDGHGGGQAKRSQGRSNLDDHARLVSGPTPNGSPAPMEKPGQLNPAHSRWLMGFPPEWDDCVPTAMRSASRKRSSS